MISFNIDDFYNLKYFGALKSDKDAMNARYRELMYISKYISRNDLLLEFGVYKGRTINHLSKLLPKNEIYGFDSFEGLPKDWDMGGKYVKKDYFKIDIPKVKDNIKLIKGYFSDTLEQWTLSTNNINKIKFINIDSDVYESAAHVLNILNNYINPGCIIRFDELCCWRSQFNEFELSNHIKRSVYSTWMNHEWKALNEWIKSNNRIVLPICRNWFQSGTVIILK